MSQQINFNINGEPIITINEQGFHYRTRFIEDAGEAYKLFMSVMKLLQHQNKIIDNAETPGLPQPTPAPTPEPTPASNPKRTTSKKTTAATETEKKPRTRRKKTDLPAE
jgi:hypothetical protein